MKGRLMMNRREALGAMTVIPAVAKAAKATQKVTLLSGMQAREWNTTGEVNAQRGMGSVEATFRQVRKDGSTGRVRVCGMGSLIIEDSP